MHYGVVMFPTDYAIRPDDLARATEERGFESLWVPEHTHIPVSRKSPWPGGGDLPKEYWHSHDPFVALAMAAAVTTTLKLGTGICLVIERDPITMAKEVATLDRLSNGRFIFGIGGGWNAEEMENHGTAFKTRFAVLRERMLAMKQIWTDDEPSFHGDYVNFDGIWPGPKPLQKPHPPILMGGDGPQLVLVQHLDQARREDQAGIPGIMAVGECVRIPVVDDAHAGKRDSLDLADLCDKCREMGRKLAW